MSSRQSETSSSSPFSSEANKRSSKWDVPPVVQHRPHRSDIKTSVQEEEKRRERRETRESPYARDYRDERKAPRSLYERGTPEDSHRDLSEKDPSEIIKPNFKVSGALAAAARTTESGIVLKYAAPEEARIPSLKWRLFPFKEDEALDPIPVHEKSVYLLGRDRDVADIPLENLSCSGQHAVIVFRQVKVKAATTGLNSFVVKPFLMDLESRNGTFLNDVRIDDSRYYELFEKDCIRFGTSSREYVLLNERTK